MTGRNLTLRSRARATCVLTALAVLLLHGCTPNAPEGARSETPDETADTAGELAVPEIDPRSYNLGGIGAFAEVVAVGVKKLALSAPLTPAEMDALIEEAERIISDNGALMYREDDFLVTDLFPEEITTDKEVLLIYLDPVKDAYLSLKAEKEALVLAGDYEGENRKDIARKMGRLLSYPEERIEEMLARPAP